MKAFFQSLFLGKRLFQLLTANVLLFVVAQFVPPLFPVAMGMLGLLGAGFLVDLAVLYRVRKGLTGFRETPEKLSNGDPNDIYISLTSYYNFPVGIRVIDEVPIQFQERDLDFTGQLKPGQTRTITYQLRPTKRGEYSFGALNVLLTSPLALARRRFRFAQDQSLPCYPSYLQMRKYHLLAASNRLHEAGVKKIRRLGHSMEFEQIRDYVRGDDIRTINWKATARRGHLMVNQFTEEKSQPVYCIVDKGRMMKMPFDGLSLLDYAINASLVLSNVALSKQDRAGLITFSEKMGVHIKASRKAIQMHLITDALYRQKTRYLESNYEILYANIRRKIGQRSLLLLFTNFDSLSALHRQLPYLRRLNRDHLLVVVFFENTELKQLTHAPAHSTEEIYLKTVAEKFASEKRQIVKELQLHGIQAILSTPAGLTVDALNKYLEIKSRNLI